jgi:hypothetical protein
MRALKLGSILVGLTVLIWAEVWGADWKYFAVGGDGIFYWYDAQGVTRQPNQVIQVWIKKVKADEIMNLVGEMVLDRTLFFTDSELNFGPVQPARYSDGPGPAPSQKNGGTGILFPRRR